MGRKSTVRQLDPRLKEAVDALLRDGRSTIDGILEKLRELASPGDALPSRSALGRYAQRAQEQMARYREAQQVASVWVEKFGKEPEGDVGRLLHEMLRSVAFQTLGQMSENEASAGAEEVMLLAKAMKDLASADKLTAERIVRIRQEVAKQCAAEAVKSVKAAGLTDEAAELIRQKLLGVAAR